jgi:DNA-binding transcriptional regulator GbsR (MarR family)
MNLTPMLQTIVLHFGEMGSRWGINRTVGQMYALFVMSSKPLNADQIVEAIGISRSNASMGLKELLSWRLIKLQHIPGDRKEYYSAPSDMWEIARILIEERRKREIDPTLTMLREALMETPASVKEEFAQQKMHEMHDLIDLVTTWSSDMQKLSSEQLQTLMKLGASAGKLLDAKNRILGTFSSESKTSDSASSAQSAASDINKD